MKKVCIGYFSITNFGAWVLIRIKFPQLGDSKSTRDICYWKMDTNYPSVTI